MGNFQQLEVEGRWEKSETIADRTFVAFFFFFEGGCQILGKDLFILIMGNII